MSGQGQQQQNETKIQYVPVPVPVQMPPMMGMGFMPPYYGYPQMQQNQGFNNPEEDGNNKPVSKPSQQQMYLNQGMFPGGMMMYPNGQMGMMMGQQGRNGNGNGQPPAFNFSGQYFYKGNGDSASQDNNSNPNQNPAQKKQSHLAALKSKTPSQIVNEFKSFTLPKLRLKRLIKLQAMMRGYHARKYLIPRRKVAFKLMENYVDRFVRNYIEDKIVPDIVLEILAYNKYNEDVHLYSTEYRAHLEVMDRIVQRVVRDQAEAVVKESTDNLVTGILRQRDQVKPAEEKDPMVLVARDVIVNSIKIDCQELAKICIEEMTFEYMEDIHIRNLIREKFMTKAVKEVVVDAIQEIAIEELFEDMILRNTKQLALPLAQHMFDLVQQEMEGAQLDKALDNYLLRQMLDIILEQANVVIDDNNKALIDIQNTLQQSSALPIQQNQQAQMMMPAGSSKNIPRNNQINQQQQYQQQSYQTSQQQLPQQ